MILQAWNRSSVSISWFVIHLNTRVRGKGATVAGLDAEGLVTASKGYLFNLRGSHGY
jgi:hypothetical protein